MLRLLINTNGAVVNYSQQSDKETLENSVSVITKWTLPCCRASYAWYLKQNRHLKYISEQT